MRLLVAVLFSFFITSIAFAQVPGPGSFEDTVGRMVENSNPSQSTVSLGKMIVNSLQSDGTKRLVTVMYLIAVLGGIIFVVKGLIQLVKDTDTGTKSGIGHGLVKVFAGALLMSLSTVVFTLSNSWSEQGGKITYLATNSDSDVRLSDLSQDPLFSTGCTVISVRADAANPNCYSALFANFARDAAGPLIQAIIVICVIWGIFLIATGLSRLANSQNPSSPYFEKTSGIILRIIFGSLAISMPFFLNTVSNSFFSGAGAFELTLLSKEPSEFVREGTNLQTKDSVNHLPVTDYYLAMMHYVFFGLIPFGLFAFASGLNSFVKASDGQQNGGLGLGAGVVKMVAGVALVNGKVFTCSMASTLGANVNMVGFCT